MSVELTGLVNEEYETRTTATGFELTGSGALTRLVVEFGDGWGHPSELPDAVGVQLEHELGVAARVVIRSGRRLRLEVTLESQADETISVPGPVLRYDGARPSVAWLAGASGEVVLPSVTGPGLLTLRRGLAAEGPEPGSVYLFDPQPWISPRQLLSAAWTYEVYPGGLLDLPPEPSWLPWTRYVPAGDAVEMSMPDGTISAHSGVTMTEDDGEFELTPHAGIVDLHVWTSAGRTTVEVGAFEPLATLRERCVDASVRLDGPTAYLAARHLAESWTSEDRLDWLDRSLGALLEQPTAWAACAASIACGLGLPLEHDAREAATAILASPSADDVILLSVHGLAPVELAKGEWPVGDFGKLGLAAVEAFGFGRITSSARPARGRDVAVAKLFAAGLGETELGLRVAAYTQAAENRLLCHLTAIPNPDDVAWLSI